MYPTREMFLEGGVRRDARALQEELGLLFILASPVIEPALHARFIVSQEWTDASLSTAKVAKPQATSRAAK